MKSGTRKWATLDELYMFHSRQLKKPATYGNAVATHFVDLVANTLSLPVHTCCTGDSHSAMVIAAPTTPMKFSVGCSISHGGWLGCGLAGLSPPHRAGFGSLGLSMLLGVWVEAVHVDDLRL